MYYYEYVRNDFHFQLIYFILFYKQFTSNIHYKTLILMFKLNFLFITRIETENLIPDE